MHKKILFIINPISGVGKQKIIEHLIEHHLDRSLYISDITYTQYKGHAYKIAQSAANNYNVVVAIGGDGTVNEIGTALVHSTTALAVIPTGSGNGFALYLNIPLNLEEAIRVINKAQVKKVDTATINGHRFVNIAGVGFDAHIAHVFAHYGTRGFWSYFKISATEFAKFTPQHYRLVIDGKEYNRSVFLISFANSSQFGNNANISPEAKIDDGLLDICIMQKFPLLASPFLAMRLFNRTLNRSKYMEIIRGKEVELTYSKPIQAHLDGEPINLENTLQIKVDALSLNVLVPLK